MSATTSIEWTDRTWNPTTGCDKVSPGCAHCYAEGVAARFWAKQYPRIEFAMPSDRDGFTIEHRPRRFTDVMTHEDRLLEPLSWRKPSRIFVNSMSDLFHEDVPDAFIDKVFAVMALAERHTFQVLTKRPPRMLAYMTSRTATTGGGCTRDIYQSAYYVTEDNNAGARVYDRPWPLPNVWLGVSVENQRFADERIPLLLETPAAVRFVSAEPLLEAVDFTLRGSRIADWDEDWHYNVLSGEEWAGPRDENHERSQHLDWVIVGGESGPGARPFDLAWARSIVGQCKAAGVPVFVKQLGAKPMHYSIGDMGSYPITNRKGGDITEFPPDLRIREFPAVTA